MMKSKTMKFFKNGVDNQKRADISFMMKRPDRKVMQKWTTEQRILARAFINEMESYCKEFVDDVKAFI